MAPGTPACRFSTGGPANGTVAPYLCTAAIAALTALTKSLRTRTDSGIVGCAVPAGRSLVTFTMASGWALLIQPSGGLGPATPRMPASICSRMAFSLSEPSMLTRPPKRLGVIVGRATREPTTSPSSAIRRMMMFCASIASGEVALSSTLSRFSTSWALSAGSTKGVPLPGEAGEAV